MFSITISIGFEMRWAEWGSGHKKLAMVTEASCSAISNQTEIVSEKFGSEKLMTRIEHNAWLWGKLNLNSAPPQNRLYITFQRCYSANALTRSCWILYDFIVGLFMLNLLSKIACQTKRPPSWRKTLNLALSYKFVFSLHKCYHSRDRHDNFECLLNLKAIAL